MFEPLDPNSEMARVHSTYAEQLSGILPLWRDPELGVEADVVFLYVGGGVGSHYIWERGTSTSYRIQTLPARPHPGRDAEISDCVLPVRYSHMNLVQAGSSSVILMFTPWHSALPLEDNINIAVNAFSRTIVLGNARELLIKGEMGVPHVSYQSLDLHDVVTIYNPVPNSLAERPSMLDLLQGNINNIDAIYNG